MAIFVKVPKRGTDIRKNIQDAVKIATKRLRLMLGISLLMNIAMGYCIVKFL